MRTADQALLDSWMLSLRAESRAVRTIGLYEKTLTTFADWLEARGRPGLIDVQRGDAAGWLSEMRERGLAANTVRNRWIALRSFYGWLVVEDELEASPIAKLIVPKGDP